MREKEKVFIGLFEGEEIYINLKDKSLTGWSLMGLRPEIEEKLRESARDCSISDYYDVKNIPSQYLDEEQFQEDMEDDWLEKHDAQGEYNIDGETYYLGFGLGTDIFNFFKEHKITNFESYKNAFEEINEDISENKFKELLKLLSIYKKDESKGYKMFLDWQEVISEFPHNTDEYKELEK